MKKKTFIVDVHRELATTVRVEATSEEEAEQKASEMVEKGQIQWSLEDHLTDDYEVKTSGEVNEKGEEQYY